MATTKTHFVDVFSLKLGLVLFSFAMDYLSVNDRKQTTRWTATTFLFIIPALLFVDVYISHIYLYTYKYVYIYIQTQTVITPVISFDIV